SNLRLRVEETVGVSAIALCRNTGESRLLIAHAYRDIINLLQHMITAGFCKKGITVTASELVAWMQAAFVIERAQRMAVQTLQRLQRDLRKFHTKLLPPPP